MADSVEPERLDICDGEVGSALVDVARGGHGPPCGDHLQVDHMRCREALVPKAPPGFVAIGAVISQGRDDHAGVDDDHRWSRSALTAAAAALSPARPPARPPARSSTSSSVGGAPLWSAWRGDTLGAIAPRLPHAGGVPVDVFGDILDLNAGHAANSSANLHVQHVILLLHQCYGVKAAWWSSFDRRRNDDRGRRRNDDRGPAGGTACGRSRTVSWRRGLHDRRSVGGSACRTPLLRTSLQRKQ